MRIVVVDLTVTGVLVLLGCLFPVSSLEGAMSVGRGLCGDRGGSGAPRAGVGVTVGVEDAGPMAESAARS